MRKLAEPRANTELGGELNSKAAAMSSSLNSCLGTCGVLLLAACGGGNEPKPGTVDFSTAEWEIVETLSPVPDVPANPTNVHADDPAAAAFGQKIFFEKRYAGALVVGDDGSNGGLGAVGEKGAVACASCHDPSSWYMDTRSRPNNVSLGAAYTVRNAPSLVNVVYYDYFGWAQKQDWPYVQASGSPESKDNTAGNRLEFAHMLFANYRDEYDAIFADPLDAALDPDAVDAARFPPTGKPKSKPEDPDGAWEMMVAADRTIIQRIMSNTGKAIEAYERLLISRNAPFDRFVAGEETAIPLSAKRGLKLFVGKAACVQCHSDPTMTDNKVHVTGVPQTGMNVPETDQGHFVDADLMLKNSYNGASQFSDDPEAGAAKLANITVDASHTGAFRTKSLRHVEHTGPYMHDGCMDTLEAVVEFYDRGGGDTAFSGTKDPLLVPLNLTSGERADLVAFLKTLTGEPVPEELTTPPDP
jgi:cytochrome c peroxidase